MLVTARKNMPFRHWSNFDIPASLHRNGDVNVDIRCIHFETSVALKELTPCPSGIHSSFPRDL